MGIIDSFKRGLTEVDGSFVTVSLFSFDDEMWDTITSHKNPAAELYHSRMFIDFFYTSQFVKHNLSLELIDECYSYMDYLFYERMTPGEREQYPYSMTNLVRSKVFSKMLENAWDLSIPNNDAIEALQVVLQANIENDTFQSFIDARNVFLDKSDEYFSGVSKKYYNSFSENTTWNDVFEYLERPYKEKS